MGRINVAYAIFEGPLGPNKSGAISLLKVWAANIVCRAKLSATCRCCEQTSTQRPRHARMERPPLQFVEPSPFDILAVACPRAQVQTSLRKGQ